MSPTLPRLLRVSEAANLLQMHPNTIRNYGKRGVLTRVRASFGQTRYLECEVLNLLDLGQAAIAS